MLNFILSFFRRRKIDLSKYEDRIDYGVLDNKQRTAMDNILMSCELGGAGAEIPPLTQEEFDQVVSQIGLHFGNDEICKNIAIKRGNSAAINLSIYEQANAHKAKLDNWVDDALSKLNEGTTEEKLKQIAKCIADHAKYESGTNNPLRLLEDGAMCGAYSMLFYKMATRIGVEAYICYGEADNGFYKGFHAWNKADGYYYDVTWYDTFPRQPKYLHSKTGWGRHYRVNDKGVQK
jgi:hypothetical protein